MYTTFNFRTKKDLKNAVEAWNKYQESISNPPAPMTVGAVLAHKHPVKTARPVTYFQPGPFGGNEPTNGTFCVEGPHYPEPHKWYAQCTAKDGCIVKVK